MNCLAGKLGEARRGYIAQIRNSQIYIKRKAAEIEPITINSIALLGSFFDIYGDGDRAQHNQILQIRRLLGMEPGTPGVVGR
jgi:hypothetical protein